MKKRIKIRYLVSLLSCILMLQFFAACGSDDNRPSVLIQGTADNPVLDEINKWAYITEYDGTQDVAEYDLLVVDGDEYLPSDLATEGLLIDEAVENYIPILFFDLLLEHKEALLAQIKMYVGNNALAYFVSFDKESNNQRIYPHVYDLAPSGASVTRIANSYADYDNDEIFETQNYINQTSDNVFNDLSNKQIEDFSIVVKTQINKWLTTSTASVANSSLTESDVPQLIHAATVFRHADDVSKEDKGWNCGDGGSHIEITYTARVYQNDGEYDPPNQYIVIDSEGTVKPDTMHCDNNNNKGWFQNYYVHTIDPDDSLIDDDPVITLISTSPETANNTTSVTSSWNVNVGVKAGIEGEDPVFEGSVAIGHNYAVTKTIQDWSVDVQGGGFGTASWKYYQSSPWVASGDTERSISHGDSGDCWEWTGYDVKMPPNLSRNTLPIHTSVVYKTLKDLRTDETNHLVNFNLKSAHHQRICQASSWWGVGTRDDYNWGSSYDPHTLTIDLSSPELDSPTKQSASQ